MMVRLDVEAGERTGRERKKIAILRFTLSLCTTRERGTICTTTCVTTFATLCTFCGLCTNAQEFFYIATGQVVCTVYRYLQSNRILSDNLPHQFFHHNHRPVHYRRSRLCGSVDFGNPPTFQRYRFGFLICKSLYRSKFRLHFLCNLLSL